MLMGLDGHSNVVEDIGRHVLNHGRQATLDASHIKTVTIAGATAAKIINSMS